MTSLQCFLCQGNQCEDSFPATPQTVDDFLNIGVCTTNGSCVKFTTRNQGAVYIFMYHSWKQNFVFLMTPHQIKQNFVQVRRSYTLFGRVRPRNVRPDVDHQVSWTNHSNKTARSASVTKTTAMPLPSLVHAKPQ